MSAFLLPILIFCAPQKRVVRFRGGVWCRCRGVHRPPGEHDLRRGRRRRIRFGDYEMGKKVETSILPASRRLVASAASQIDDGRRSSACPVQGMATMPSPRRSTKPAMRGCGRATSRTGAAMELDAVVADENDRAAPGRTRDQRTGEPALAGARRAADQQRGATNRHRGRVDRMRRNRQPASQAAGSQTVNRAPSTSSGSSVVRSRLGAVLGDDLAAVRLDDLARDRQAEARVLAESLVRPVGVEALEDALERVGGNARAVVVDDDLVAASRRRARSQRTQVDAHAAPRPRRTSARCRSGC